MKDLYKGKDWREDKFYAEFIAPLISKMSLDQNEIDILKDYIFKLKSDFNASILKQKTLISVQLLDMSIEKFCLYFERSNSQGLNLSFSDIVTAKVYTKFKLQREKKDAVEKYKYFRENLLESTLRYINYLANNSVTKKSILKDLNGDHFTAYWKDVVKDLSYIQEWLVEQRWVFNVEDITYKTMLLPILSFYQNLPNKEMSQATPQQLEHLKFWFYGSMFDTRYGGARHGSTNVVIKEDCDIMKKIAQGDCPDKLYWQKIRIEYSYDEFLKIDYNKNTKFKTLNYLIWNKSPFLNFKNHAKVSFADKVDVHHVFPSGYLKEHFGENSEEYDVSDSILNKVFINKIENIKIGKKAPSIYLNELKKTHPNINESIQSHLLGGNNKLIDGAFDNQFKDFLRLRYSEFESLLSKLKRACDKLHNGVNIDLWN